MESTRRNFVLSGVVGASVALTPREALSSPPVQVVGEISSIVEEIDPHTGEDTVVVTVEFLSDVAGSFQRGSLSLRMAPEKAHGLAYGDSVSLSFTL